MKSSDKQNFFFSIISEMCDFQYLPVVKLPDGQYKEILSSIRPTIDDERDEYLARNLPLFLPPYCFSRREKPCGFFFESEAFQEGDTSFVQGTFVSSAGSPGNLGFSWMCSLFQYS